MVTKSRTKNEATIDALYHVPDNGKAELVGGRLVPMSPTGGTLGFAAGEIFASLREHKRKHDGGYAFGDNVGFLVNLPGRKSFSPDAAWFVGALQGLKFLQGAPRFAVEVRSEGDYGPKAERAMAKKRRDYFAAGTKVVWDVDLLSLDVVKKYSAADPLNPTVFRRGDLADAEPAVPGWQILVDSLFV